MLRAFVPRPAVLLALTVALASLAAPRVDLGAQAPTRERTVFASALDASGKPIDGLSVADFTVREDGARREVLRVSRAIEPMDIALLVDNSASSAELLLSLRDGLKQFVTTMLPAGDPAGAPRHNIALVGLAARPTILVEYTSDPKRLTDGISRLFTDSTSGMTLLDAIVEVSRGLEKRESSRAVVVPVVTDGIEFTNRYYRDVIDAMTRAGVGFHALTVGTFSVSDDDAVRNRSLVLDEGARATGGQRVTLLSANAVPRALDRLAAELSSQYKVVYGHPESLIPPEKIEVTASRAGITVRATPLRGQKTGA
jgi:VWFA-related protein